MTNAEIERCRSRVLEVRREMVAKGNLTDACRQSTECLLIQLEDLPSKPEGPEFDALIRDVQAYAVSTPPRDNDGPPVKIGAVTFRILRVLFSIYGAEFTEGWDRLNVEQLRVLNNGSKSLHRLMSASVPRRVKIQCGSPALPYRC